MKRLDVPAGYDRRLGKIRIAEMSSLVGSIPRLFYKIDFIPVEIDIYTYCYAVVYTGYSRWFDVLNEGELIPEYKVEMKETENDFVVTDVTRI